MCQNSDRRRRINNIGTSDIFDIINHVSVDHVNVNYVNVDHVNVNVNVNINVNVNVNVNVNHDWDTGLPSSVVNDGTVILPSVQAITDFCANSGPAGATPASFHSQAQYDFLTTTTRLGSATPAWLNLYYDMTTGILMWIDGSPVDYIHAPLTNTDPTATMQGWFFDDIWGPDDPADANMNNVWCRAPVP
ncbi:hypothetical protein WR25_23661 [Diploscapter pachys]|uniref:Uncharacterized protein n=1 Tax=Diploscapter pachys TaxID=2018661 RepID=A0A2A2K486_9BILA|nr:hypothetical protein WR25_23661 [Diploscapter pachys]